MELRMSCFVSLEQNIGYIYFHGEQLKYLLSTVLSFVKYYRRSSTMDEKMAVVLRDFGKH